MMNVGDYVRTHDGRIDKIVDIKNDYIYIENSDYGYRETYLTSSPNIIDLIEVGDYVNGYRVSYSGGFYQYWDDMFDKNTIETDKDIKSIVTK